MELPSSLCRTLAMQMHRRGNQDHFKGIRDFTTVFST